MFCRFPDDVLCIQPYDAWVGYQSPQRKDRVNLIETAMRDARWTDEWGTQWAHAFGGVGATPVAWPLQDWSQLDEYLAHRMPDPCAPGRLDAALPFLYAHGKTKYCVGLIHLTLFERMHSLRGMENLFMDFYTNEREVDRLAEAVADYQMEVIRGWGRTGVDAVFLTDDWGTQTSLMISVEMWEKYFAKHYRRLFDQAHDCGMDVMFHSCGNVMAIVANLIDLGVDVIDPIQPGAMDVDEVARRFGGRVAFLGGINDQLLASYSPAQIRDVVRKTIDTLGRPFANAYVVAAANVMTPEIPFENLEALFNACHEQ